MAVTSMYPPAIWLAMAKALPPRKFPIVFHSPALSHLTSREDVLQVRLRSLYPLYNYGGQISLRETLLFLTSLCQVRLRSLYPLYNYGGQISLREIWWTAPGSNRRPRRCERRALPSELAAQVLTKDASTSDEKVRRRKDKTLLHSFSFILPL